MDENSELLTPELASKRASKAESLTTFRQHFHRWIQAIRYTASSIFSHNELNTIVQPLKRPFLFLARPSNSPDLACNPGANESSGSQNALEGRETPEMTKFLREIPQPSSSYSLLDGFQATLYKNVQRRLTKKGLLLPEKPRPVSNSRPKSSLSLEHRKLVRDFRVANVQAAVVVDELGQIDNMLSELHIRRRAAFQKMEQLNSQCTQLQARLSIVEKEALDEDTHELEDVVTSNKTVTEQQFEEEADEEAGELGEERELGEDGVPNEFRDDEQKEKTSHMRTDGTEEHASRGPFKRKISLSSFHQIPVGTPQKNIEVSQGQPITALDFNEPFGLLLPACADGTVNVWDLSSTKCLGELVGHTQRVPCLSARDSIAVTGSWDRTARIWNLQNCLRSENPSDGTETVYDSDTYYFAEDAPHVHAERAVAVLSSHTESITALSLSPENVLVTGANDKTIRQWDMLTGRCVQTLDLVWTVAQEAATGHASTVPLHSSLNEPLVGALDCLDAAVASGTSDGIIRLWDLRVGLSQRSLCGHTGLITALQFDGVYVFSGSQDHTVRIWDLRMGSVCESVTFAGPVSSVCVSEDRFAVSSVGEPLCVLDPNERRTWICDQVSSGHGSLPDDHEIPSSNTSFSNVTALQYKDRFLVSGNELGVVSMFSI
ncbi:CCR4-Not complex subunit Caf4/Mdv1 [Schizosaccharomyces japonicus yFS275]|uniref:CCR4-Not complex subunit Caf4/Mdv1 n=1 Tax=Schizosaccharomyces japonicus (strain yFS275 / FY16936) TaxID=402676 RepID=B6K7L6_SCHJY|nr:CCR4-Not complex subunit Caf4/Mdv1 [Schizosaccharomyces japonicus yFS275]EEB09520.1 CCR4-Not complex subunit Caf4/Mdv1 [Schizosaccharomyces japonicus yFS275]